MSASRREWRDRVFRRLYDLAATTNEFAVVPDGLSHAIQIGDTSYRLATVRPRKSAPTFVPYRSRLRSNRHKWLLPAADQQSLFGDKEVAGSDGMPVPLFFDYEGALFVGWPDFVDTRGVGWGVEAACVVAELKLHVADEPTAPAPEESVPDLLVPALKSKDSTS